VDHTTQDILDEMAKHAKVSPDVSVDDPRPGDLERSVLDNALLKAQGWEPKVSFEEGLRLTLDWFRERG
jgi:UDP-glucose 4-epimerase